MRKTLAAIALAHAPGHVHAWAYKANLLKEEIKLAEMNGDAARKAEFERRYAEALSEHKRVSAAAAGRPREEF